MKLYVFDICNTLFYTNTTLGYIEYVLKKKGHKVLYLLIKLSVKRYLPFFYIFYIINFLTNRDYHRTFILLVLKGQSKKELYSLARQYHSEVLTHLEVPATVNMLKNWKKNGAKIILLSSSIDPVVHEIADHFNVQFESSKLQFKNDITTGRLEIDLTGRKHLVLERFKKTKTYLEYGVITDNVTDKKLLEMADKKFIIIESKSDRSKWGDFNANYLEI